MRLQTGWEITAQQWRQEQIRVHAWRLEHFKPNEFWVSAWPNGIICPFCGGDHSTPRSPAQSGLAQKDTDHYNELASANWPPKKWLTSLREKIEKVALQEIEDAREGERE
jgi:hypothetical protein